MARIDPYTQQVNFDSGIRQETPGTTSRDVGHGLSHLGGALEEAGGEVRTAARIVQEVKSREEVTSAQTKLFVAENELSTHLKQMEATHDPEDRTLPEKFNAFAGDYLNKIAPRYETGHGEEAFRSGAARLTAKLGADAAIADSNIAAKSATINYQKALDVVRNGVLENPNSMHDQMIAMGEMISDKNGHYAFIPAIARKALIKSTEEQIALSAAQGEIKIDPTEALKKIQGGLFSQYLDADKTFTLERQAEIGIHAQNIDRVVGKQQEEYARQVEIRAMKSELVAKLGNGKLKISDIMNEKTADGHTFLDRDPVGAESMINLLHQRSRERLQPVQTDPTVALRLFEDIHRPADDPQKLKNEIPLNKAYIARQLDWTMFTHLRKEQDDARTPEGEKLGSQKTDMIKAVTQTIDKSNPLMGKIDPTGGLMLYGFKQFMESEITRYQKEGKDINNLFNPAKENEFLGRPEALRPFIKSMDESMRYFTDQFRKSKGIEEPKGGTHPEQQRKPGEDAESYLKRFRDFIK
jgi:hypothetical protein